MTGLQGSLTGAEERSGRGRRLPADKYDARRNELAQAAITTLAELGYAKTSLREIAQKSEFTHAVLHYYFKDKTDLIRCSIRQFKSHCVTRYDEVVATARTQEALTAGFMGKLADTMRDEPRLHCLWYDLRAQALFDDGFRDVVNEIDKSLENMIWRIVTQYAVLGGQAPAITPGAAYAIFDGLFQKHLLLHMSGKPGAIDGMLDEVVQLLPHMVATPA